MNNYENVLSKAGLRRRGWKRSSKVLLVAAVMATATLTVAAAVYGGSDAFRGILKVQDSAGDQAAPTSSAEPVLDRAGMILGNKTQSGGVEVSLRAVVGDERNIKLLVDILNPSGEPLAVKQADGSLSFDMLQFGDVVLKQSGKPVSGGYGFEVIDNDPTDNKSTLLINYEVTDAPVRGQAYSLQLNDLMQIAVMKGTAIGMEPNDLYNIISQFSGHTDADFENDGYSDDGAGNVEYSYKLVTDSDKSLALSKDYPGIQVTNAAIRQGILYLRGTASSQAEQDRIMTSAALVNATTGNTFNWNSAGSDEDNGKIKWTISFSGVDSAEDVKGYVWAFGEGEGLFPVAEGVWDFDFKLDYENTTRTLEPKQEVVWEGYSLTVKKMEVSPFTLYLDFTTDSSTATKMYPETDWGTYRALSDWEKSARTIILTMKDGSTVKVGNPGGMQDGSGAYRLSYALDVVIDPQQISTIQIGDQTMEMSK